MFPNLSNKPMLAALAARRPIDGRIALVVAHPDDETLAAGGSLRLMRNLLLVHVTDGAPRRLDDIGRNGFVGPEQYANARAGELALALALSGADPVLASLDVPDQEAVDRLDEITDRLRELFRFYRVDSVMTHAYEGGHPDHDAVAMAVRSLGLPTIEFAGYHADVAGRLVAQAFLPSDDRDITTVVLSPSDLGRKRAMLDCFRTQTEILSQFDLAIERFREAPSYDFGLPPHPGQLLYERWGWMDGEAWRERAGQSRCAV